MWDRMSNAYHISDSLISTLISIEIIVFFVKGVIISKIIFISIY